MTRRLFPDHAYRGVTQVGADGTPMLAEVGAPVTVYLDPAATVLADITDIAGNPVEGSTLRTDQNSWVPLFYGPAAAAVDAGYGPDTLYIRVGTGPVQLVRSESSERFRQYEGVIEAFRTTVAALNDRVTALESPDTGDKTAPTAPVLATPTVNALTVTVTWTASTDASGIASYTIQRKLSTDPDTAWATVATVAGTSTSYANETSVAATYNFRAQAVDKSPNANRSAFSNVVSATTTAPTGDVTAPTVPTGLATSGVTDTGVTLGWTASTDASGINSYTVQRSIDDATWTVIANITGVPPATTFADSGLTAGTRYYYRVRAVDNSANLNPSAYSPSVNVTTTGGGTVTAEFAHLPQLTRLGSNRAEKFETSPFVRGSSAGVGMRLGMARLYKAVTVGGTTWPGVDAVMRPGSSQSGDDETLSYFKTGHWLTLSAHPPKPSGGALTWPDGKTSYQRIADGFYDGPADVGNTTQGLHGMFNRLYNLPFGQAVDANYAGPAGQNGKQYGGNMAPVVYWSTHHEPEGDTEYGTPEQYRRVLNHVRRVSERCRTRFGTQPNAVKRVQIGTILMAWTDPSNLGVAGGWGDWFDPSTGPTDVDWFGLDQYWPKVLPSPDPTTNLANTGADTTGEVGPRIWKRNANSKPGLNQIVQWVDSQLGKNKPVILGEVGVNKWDPASATGAENYKNDFIRRIAPYVKGNVANTAMHNRGNDGPGGSAKIAAVIWFQNDSAANNGHPATIRLYRDVDATALDHFRDALVALKNDVVT